MDTEENGHRGLARARHPPCRSGPPPADRVNGLTLTSREVWHPLQVPSTVQAGGSTPESTFSERPWSRSFQTSA